MSIISGPASHPSKDLLHWIPSGIPRRGDEYVDVSCRAVVRITPQTLRATWRNDTYFFCSATCLRRFLQAPDALLTVRGVRFAEKQLRNEFTVVAENATTKYMQRN